MACVQMYLPDHLHRATYEQSYLQCLKYVHENGCPWDSNLCTEAGQRGHLVCLTYAHEHGCPWNEKTYRATAEGGHIACLKYVHMNGCPRAELDLTKIGRQDCRQYLSSAPSENT